MASLPEVYRTRCLLCGTPFVTSLDEDGQCSGECPKCGESVMSEPERVEIELEQEQSDIQQPWPAAPESMDCATCAKPFDPTDFAQVMFHEHKGLTEHPAMQKMLADIPPGELLEKIGTPPYMAPEQPAPTCPYCGCAAQLTRIHYGEVWACRPCDARVGCHKGTERPLGTLANAELRRARIRVHELFDPLWKEGGWRRPAAYAWLGRQLQLDPCHIAQMDLKQADQAEELLRGLAPGYPHPPPCPCEGECVPCPACGYCECESGGCACASYGHGASHTKGPCWREL